MAAGVIDLVLVGIIALAGIYIVRSGILTQPVATAPVQTPVVPAAGGDGTTTPTTPATPAAPVDPLQALLDQLLGTGGSNVLPTQPGAGGTLQPGQQQPIFQGNPAECSSRYGGRCDTECQTGNSSLCQACQMACGGAMIGAVQTLPPQGGANQQLCSSRYNGKCNTECESGNSSECQQCKTACGSFGAYSYYVQSPTHPMTATVFNNRSNYSRNANWQIGVQNAR